MISPGLLLDLTTKGYTTDLQLSVVTWTLQACRIHWPPNIPISHSHRLDLKRSSLSFEHPSTQLSHTDQNSTPSKPRRISRRSDMSESASRQSACSHDHRQNNRKISDSQARIRLVDPAGSCMPSSPDSEGKEWPGHAYRAYQAYLGIVGVTVGITMHIICSCFRVLSDEDIFSGMSPLCSTGLRIGNPCMIFQDRVDLRIWRNVGGRFSVDLLSTSCRLIGSER